MKKVKINLVPIKITRRCNMRCSHGIRGPTQDIDINLNINNIFRHTDIQVK